MGGSDIRMRRPGRRPAMCGVALPGLLHPRCMIPGHAAVSPAAVCISNARCQTGSVADSERPVLPEPPAALAHGWRTRWRSIIGAGVPLTGGIPSGALMRGGAAHHARAVSSPALPRPRSGAAAASRRRGGASRCSRLPAAAAAFPERRGRSWGAPPAWVTVQTGIRS